MIGIIGAIDYELNYFFQHMIIARTEIIADKTFYIGKIKNHNVVIVKSGIGKVNASITTTILIDRFDARLIINTGVAGGLAPVEVGDIIIAKGISYFDVSLTEIDDVPYGQMGTDPLVVNISAENLEKCKNIFDKLGYKYLSVLGVEMEGMAIALTAYKFNRPFVSIRGVSDIIDTPDQPKNYREVVKSVASKTSQFVLDFLEVVDE